MAKEYSSKGVDFLFVYTREAHPGENYPAHRSMGQKLSFARRFKELWNIERPVLVDGLDGAGHRQYGFLPNMTFFVGRGGRLLFRSDWTDADSILAMLDYQLAMRERRRAGERMTPFFMEAQGYRAPDMEEFRKLLEQTGPQATEDFRQFMEQTGGKGSPRPE